MLIATEFIARGNIFLKILVKNFIAADLRINFSFFYVKVILTINVNFHLIDELTSFYLIPYVTLHIFICTSLFGSYIIMTVNHKKERSNGSWYRLIKKPSSCHRRQWLLLLLLHVSIIDLIFSHRYFLMQKKKQIVKQIKSIWEEHSDK